MKNTVLFLALSTITLSSASVEALPMRDSGGYDNSQAWSYQHQNEGYGPPRHQHLSENTDQEDPRAKSRHAQPGAGNAKPQGGGRSQSPATQPSAQPQGGGRSQSSVTPPFAQSQGGGRQPSQGQSSSRRKDAEDLRHLDMGN